MNVRIFWVCAMECMLHRSDLGLYCPAKDFWRNGVRTHVNSKRDTPCLCFIWFSFWSLSLSLRGLCLPSPYSCSFSPSLSWLVWYFKCPAMFAAGDYSCCDLVSDKDMFQEIVKLRLQMATARLGCWRERSDSTLFTVLQMATARLGCWYSALFTILQMATARLGCWGGRSDSTLFTILQMATDSTLFTILQMATARLGCWGGRSDSTLFTILQMATDSTLFTILQMATDSTLFTILQMATDSTLFTILQMATARLECWRGRSDSTLFTMYPHTLCLDHARSRDLRHYVHSAVCVNGEQPFTGPLLSSGWLGFSGLTQLSWRRGRPRVEHVQHLLFCQWLCQTL